MSDPTIDRVTVTIADHIADVRLNRPDKLNALDPAMLEAIIAAGQRVRNEPGLRAVVLSGEGRGFCAGIDVGNFTAPPAADAGKGAPRKLTDRSHGNANTFQEVAMTWRKCPVPVIAAVHGICYGGGLQIMSGADIRVVAPDARLAIMEMRWGLVPDMAGYALWPGYVRDDVLRELTYTNREFSGEEAGRNGFATIVDTDPHRRATAIAREIAGKNPDAIRAAKQLFETSSPLDTDAILIAESEAQQSVIRTPNQIEAVMAQMQKRAAAFQD